MIKNIFIVIIFTTTTAISPINSSAYICGPQGSKKYHYSSSCRGLSACKHKIIKVSKDKAVSLGLTLCGWED